MKITIEGEFTTLNQYSDAERISWQKAAAIKKSETERVAWSVKGTGPVTEEYPLDLTMFWYRVDKRSDPDNIAFAVKFVLDGLQTGGVISGDGWKQINSICHVFRVDPQCPRVEIFLEGA